MSLDSLAPSPTIQSNVDSTPYPTISKIVVDVFSPTGDLAASIAIPICLGFVGVAIWVVFYYRDKGRKALEIRAEEVHLLTLAGIRENLVAQGKSENEIEDYFQTETLTPNLPVYEGIHTVMFSSLSKFIRFFSDHLWRKFFEIRLKVDPSCARSLEIRKVAVRAEHSMSPTDNLENEPRLFSSKKRLSMRLLPKNAHDSLERAARRSILHEAPGGGQQIAMKRVRGRWSESTSPTRVDCDSPHESTRSTNLIDGFPPDCGPDRMHMMLSYSKAIHERLMHTPHKRHWLAGGIWDPAFDQPSCMSRFLPNRDGRYVSLFPLHENFGQHSVGETPCEVMCPGWKLNVDKLMRSRCSLLRCRDDADPLLQFPVGIRLYFRMLKFMYRLFFWITLIYMFMMGTYWYGSSWDSAEKHFKLSPPFSIIDRLHYSLFFMSLGSLGENKLDCMDALEGSRLELSCSTGYIKSLRAFYGDPLGTCSCPAAQMPNALGDCPEGVKFGSRNGQKMERCDYVGDTDTEGYCLLGETLFGDSCCAQKASFDGHFNAAPDLSTLIPRDNPLCRSDTAQYLVQGHCLGQKRCNLTASFNHTDEYSPRMFDGQTLLCSRFDSNTSSAHVCRESLGKSGNWSQCPESPGSHRLVVYAECSNDYIVYPLKSDLGIWFRDWYVGKHHISWCLATIDAVAMLFILAMLRWLEFKEEEVVTSTNNETCTCGDYTVLMTSVPTHADAATLKREIAKFLEKELSVVKPVNREGPIEVCDINFGLNNGRQLRMFKRRGLLARKLDLLEEKCLLMKRQRGIVARCFHNQRMLVLDEEVRILRAQFKRACQDARLHKEVLEPKCAFITFLDQEGKERCLRAFSPPPWFSLFAQSSPRFFGSGNKAVGFLPCIVPAPEPEDIIWENLTTPTWLRVLKSAFTNVVIFSLMITSFAFVLGLMSFSRAAASKTDFISTADSLCANYTYLFNETGFSPEVVGSGGRGAPLITKQMALIDYFPDAFNASGGQQGLFSCYCDAIRSSTDGKSKEATVLITNPNTGASENLCLSLSKDTSHSQALSSLALGGATLTVTAVNLGLNAVYSLLIDFEGPSSRTEKVLLLTRKLALAMIVNTGFLTLVINGNPSYFTGGTSYVERLLSTLHVFVGSEKDFGEGWYLNVGTSLVLTMLINILAMNLYKYAEWGLSDLARFLDRAACDRQCGGAGSKLPGRISSKTTQVQLEALHAGPLFLLEDRYACLLNTFFVCIIYSAGIPILIPVLFATIAITYGVDKHTLLRAYRLPMALDHTLALGTTKYMKYAVFIHLVFASWMFSNPDIFDSTSLIPPLSTEFTNMTFALTEAPEDNSFNCTKNSSVTCGNSTANVTQYSSATTDIFITDHVSKEIVASFTNSGLQLLGRLSLSWENILSYFLCAVLILISWAVTFLWPVITGVIPFRRLICRNGLKKHEIARDVEVVRDGSTESNACWSRALSGTRRRNRKRNPECNWRSDIDESECPHSRLRHHPVYGHSGENIGEGNPDYFHAIKQSDLEELVASRNVDTQILKAFRSELEWRATHPERATSRKQMMGLCSYDYQVNAEYKRMYALDSKSYQRFKAGTLNVSDADYLLRPRGHLGRLVASMYDLFRSQDDPTAVFPDPPDAGRVALVGVLPGCVTGPRVVVTLALPGAAIYAADVPTVTSSHGGGGRHFLDVPGVGPLRVDPPQGIESYGVPEIQFEIPCVEVPTNGRFSNAAAQALTKSSKEEEKEKRTTLSRISLWCARWWKPRWARELEGIDYSELTRSAARNFLQQRARPESHRRSQEFSRSALDDTLEEEMLRVEMGPPRFID